MLHVLEQSQLSVGSLCVDDGLEGSGQLLHCYFQACLHIVRWAERQKERCETCKTSIVKGKKALHPANNNSYNNKSYQKPRTFPLIKLRMRGVTRLRRRPKPSKQRTKNCITQSSWGFVSYYTLQPKAVWRDMTERVVIDQLPCGETQSVKIHKLFENLQLRLHLMYHS